MQHGNDPTQAAGMRSRALAVLALCLFFNVVGRGVGDAYLVFLLPLQAEFGWQRAQLTGVYSVLMLVAGLASPVAGMLFERYGARTLYATGLAVLAVGTLVASSAQALWQLYLGVGLLVGFGCGCVGMVPAAAMLSWWFRRRLSTAIGVAYGGFGLGTLLIVPLAQRLVDAHGWRTTYQVLGIALLLLTMASLVLPWRGIAVRRPAKVVSATGIALGRPLRDALRQRRFWWLVQVMFFTALGMYLVLAQAIVYLVDVGFTPLQAATAYGATGMLSVVGVVSSGWLADRFSHRSAATLSFAGTALGIAALYAMSYGASLALLALYVIAFGSCQGARGPLVAALSTRLFSGQGDASIYGVIYAFMSIGIAAGAALSGGLHDWTGGYRTAFGLALASIALAALPFWLSGRDLVPRPVSANATNATPS